MTRCKITRRGFKSRNYPTPADVIEQAEEYIAAEREQGARAIFAQLSCTPYTGPGSAGDRGAYTLELHVSQQEEKHILRAGRATHSLYTIERSGTEVPS